MGKHGISKWSFQHLTLNFLNICKNNCYTNEIFKKNSYKNFKLDYFLEQQDFFFDLSWFINWRIECIVQLFIWKHNVYKQMRCSIVSGKESALGAIGGGESLALIK